MRHLLLALTLLVAGCASNSTKPTTGSIPKATVVKEISAPKLGPVPSLSPETQGLRDKLAEVTAKAARSEAWSMKLVDQTKEAKARADAAFTDGLIAGSAEADKFRSHAEMLQRTAEENASQAAELFAQVQTSSTKANNLSVQVGNLESMTKTLASTNEAIASELVATRGQVGDLQTQLSGETQKTAKAVAEKDVEKDRANGWRKKFLFATGLLTICGIFIAAKLLR